MVARTNLRAISKGLVGLVQDGKEILYAAAAQIERSAPGIIAQATQKANQAREYLKDKTQKTQTTGKIFLGTIQEKYNRFEKEFFTDGNFNRERASKALENIADATEQFGDRVVAQLRVMVSTGVDKVKQDYRVLVPTQEEREGKYAGIGSSYPGILFREDYENCLAFSARIGVKLPAEKRKKIMSDIKAYAIVKNWDRISS